MGKLIKPEGSPWGRKASQRKAGAFGAGRAAAGRPGAGGQGGGGGWITGPLLAVVFFGLSFGFFWVRDHYPGLGPVALLAELTGNSGRSDVVKLNGPLDVVPVDKPAAETLVGRAEVIDGDTIVIAGQHIRLNGIDAPERDQTCRDAPGHSWDCGVQSGLYLEAFIKRSLPTRCDFIEWDQYGRFVGDCFRADGVSLQAGLVRAGFALDWPKYSDGRFAGLQREAQAGKDGMWIGQFENPWDFRAGQRALADAAPDARPVSLFGKLKAATGLGGCTIKGNISYNSGKKIYHVPGQEYYDRTVISPSKGERWFCSEAEARAAGWSRAGR